MMAHVWLDCDPGHDDATAILLAAHSPNIKLIGISAVSGNQSIDKTFRNSKVMAAVAGIGRGDRSDPCFEGVNDVVPVVCGQERPLLREPKHDPGIHGESGLDGSDSLRQFSEAVTTPHQCDLSATLPVPGVLEMAKAIWVSTEPVTLVATGALTNVALLLSLYPSIKSKLARIVIMGGCMGVGNRHPVAEFNIVCDPEATAIVFESGLEVVMVPLEVTHTALATEAVLDRVRSIGNSSPFSHMIFELLTFFKETYEREFGFDGGPPVHDPCAIAYVISPEMFECKLMRVDVVCGEHLCAGQTVCDIWGVSEKPKNVKVCTKMNVPRFWELVLEALTACDSVSPFNRWCAENGVSAAPAAKRKRDTA